MLRVKAEDACSLGYCLRGVKAFCKKHSLDYKKFVKEGLPIEEVEQINDVMVKRLVEFVRGRQ